MVLQKLLKMLGNYIIFIRDILPEMLENVPLQVRQRLWFQHDGAPAHFALDVREYLNKVFLKSLDWEGWSSTVATTFSRSNSYGFLYLEGVELFGVRDTDRHTRRAGLPMWQKLQQLFVRHSHLHADNSCALM